MSAQLPRWVLTSDRLPPSNVPEECNPYYIIRTKYGASQAMFIEGEWWASYATKVAVPVVKWLEDIEHEAVKEEAEDDDDEA